MNGFSWRGLIRALIAIGLAVLASVIVEVIALLIFSVFPTASPRWVASIMSGGVLVVGFVIAWDEMER